MSFSLRDGLAFAAFGFFGALPVRLLAGGEAPAPVEFRVLEQTRIEMGDHAVIQNRVAPPVLPARRQDAFPAGPVPAAATQAEPEGQADKKRGVIFLSATVYDRGVTLLRWPCPGGECRAFSNVDFNFLAATGEIETADTVFTVFMGLENESRASATTRVPALSEFGSARAEYFLVEDKAGPESAEALEVLDALHRHYEANRPLLIEGFRQREAARLAREAEVRDRPPAKPDTVINFWPADAGQVREMQARKSGTLAGEEQR